MTDISKTSHRITTSFRNHSKYTGHSVIIKGTGDKTFNFGKDLGARVAKRASKKLDRSAKKTPAKNPKQKLSSRFPQSPSIIKPQGLIVPSQLLGKVPTGALKCMEVGADAVQRLMVEDQYNWVTAKFVGQQMTIGRKAALYLPAKMKPAVTDHNAQLEALQKEISTAVPKAMADLRAQHPDAPIGKLLQAVVDSLNQELSELLGVLGLYTEAWLQYGDPETARHLNVYNYYMEKNFRLYQTGDMDGGTENNGIPMSSFHVGDVIITSYDGMGLGTIPGGRGPVKIHLLLVPRDMARVMINAMPLLNHEGWHQIDDDTDGFNKERITFLKKLFLSAYKAGTLRLSSDTYQVQGSPESSIMVLAKFFIDAIGEIGADINGGIQSTGWAFAASMLQTFPGLSIRDGLIRDAKQLLRTTSVYFLKKVGSQLALQFEVHPQDYIRAKLNGDALEFMGFNERAAYFRAVADEAVNGAPEFCGWFNAQSRDEKDFIKIPTADILAAGRIMVQALMYQKWQSTNGKAIAEIVLWNQKMEDKATVIRQALLNGQKTLPTNIGTIHPQYIAAGNAQALWERSGQVDDVMSFSLELAEDTLCMYEELQQREAA